MESLAKMKIGFLVSYAESDEADFLCKGFRTEMVTVKRHIAGFAESRLQSKELLISNVR